MIDRFPKTLTPWYLRILFASILMFGSEILLWLNPLEYTAGDWLLLIPGYIILAALILDLAARYRIRDAYDAMTVAAIYGLLNALLLNPQSALTLPPDTIVTRGLGGHTLLGFEMFGLWLALTGGQISRYRRLLLIACIWIGVYWGVWVRWSPIYTDLSDIEVPITTMLLYGIASIAVILALFTLTIRRTTNLTPPDLRLSVIEWGGVLILLVILFIVRVAQGYITSGAFFLIAVLIIGCVAVLWFRRLERGKTLLDAHIPPTPLGWNWIFLALAIFFALSVIAYHWPLINFVGITQFSLMTLGFAGVGLGWLPLIAMILGVRALDKQSRTNKL